MARYWVRYGAVTDEARARTWNGGPSGMKKAATVGYWNKVKAALQFGRQQLECEVLR